MPGGKLRVNAAAGLRASCWGERLDEALEVAFAPQSRKRRPGIARREYISRHSRTNDRRRQLEGSTCLGMASG
jgi:hypothetical protein